MYRQRIAYFSLNCLYFSKAKRESETSYGIELFDSVVQHKTWFERQKIVQLF